MSHKLPKRLKWHGKPGQCWKLFSTCLTGPDAGYKTYCVLPKGHEGQCSICEPSAPHSPPAASLPRQPGDPLFDGAEESLREPPAALSGDAGLWRKRLYRVADNYGMVGVGHKTLIEAADRIEALNIKVANLDRAWAGMNEEQAKQWRRAEAAEAALAERDAAIVRVNEKLAQLREDLRKK